jgi:hypothetical protein
MRLPARIADTARWAEVSFGPMSNGFEIIVATLLSVRAEFPRLQGTFQYLYVVNYYSIFGINRHATG